MSILDYCKQLYLFTPYEYEVIQMLIKEYIDGKTNLFDYLKQIDLNEIQFYWYRDSNEDVLGGFHSLSYDPKTKKYAIYINMFFQEVKLKNSIDTIALCLDTILHELKHFYQLKRYGFFVYGILQLPIIRQFTIEKSADKISDCVCSLKIPTLLNIREIIFLKVKYNINAYYLNDKEKEIIALIQNKHVDLNEFRQNVKLISYRQIEEYLKNI